MIFLSALGEQMAFIREVREDEIEEVMRINRRELPENYPYFIFRYFYLTWGNYFLVAIEDGKVVGYIMGSIEKKSNPRNPEVMEIEGMPDEVGHIISFAVLREYQGRGIGSALLKEELERFSTAVKAVYLEVRVSNERAIKIYKKFGFKPIKVIKRYYLDGEDAYLMVKFL